jgi:hypothetical protein
MSNVRGWSGYPPKLSVKADIPDGQLRVKPRPLVSGPHVSFGRLRTNGQVGKPANAVPVDKAVVEPGAIAALIDFDDTVQHYIVIEDVSVSPPST